MTTPFKALRGSAGLAALAAFAVLAYSPLAHADTQTRTTSYEYDSAGLPSKTTVEPSSPNNCLQAVVTRDSFGHASSTTNSTCAGATAPATTSAGSRSSSNNFGPDGHFVISSTNAANQSETKAYDARFGATTSLTGPNGLTTSWQYDNFGRKTKEIRSDGTYTTYTYSLCTDSGASCPGPIAGAASVWVAIAQSHAVNGAANAPEQRSYYDGLNRVVRSQTQGFDGAGAAPTLVKDTEYNALGQVSRQSSSYALSGGTPVWSSFTYDALGRVASQSVPDPAAPGSLATTTFSYNGLVTSSTNAKTQTKTVTKNARGQITSVVDPLGSSISYSFDAQGNLLSTNAAGSITTMGYDIRGNKTSMLDPAMGSWTYSYNAYGELVGQRDSLNQSVSIAYDSLGRMVQRNEPDLNSQWSYDTKFDGTACGKGVGKLCEAKADNGYKRNHSYDTLGRLVQTATTLDDPANPATVSESFDANTGRVTSKTWPTGYQATYSYSALGFLNSVTGGGTNGFAQTVSYQIQAINANGQITQYRTGNTVTAVKTYDPLTQRLTGLTATADGQTSGNVIHQNYGYDSLGNLTSRSDTSPSVGTQESYSYDSLNRLTTATLLGGAVSPPTTTEVQYDARGNITYKSDVGRYWYDAARPNRMTNVTLETAPNAIQTLTGTRALSYAFDDLMPGAQTVNGIQVGNGNLQYTVSQDTAHSLHTVRGESYTSFNMPNVITYGNFITSTTSSQDRTLSYVYGPEHQRIKENVALTGNGTSSYFAGNTWYLNGADGLGLSFEKEVRANGTTENKHYVSAAGVVFALFTSRTGNLNGLATTTTSYFHKDHLGSIAAMTDATGAVTERLAYDPWGKRRFINTTPGLPDTLDAIVGKNTDRGYTEQEHLDEIGVIHMNGRIYDPLVGRFMSADPYVQAPTDLRTFNRYSYVWNNPLKGFDPTGYEEENACTSCGGGSTSTEADIGGWGREDRAGEPETRPDRTNNGKPPGQDCISCTWSTIYDANWGKDNAAGSGQTKEPTGNSSTQQTGAPTVDGNANVQSMGSPTTSVTTNGSATSSDLSFVNLTDPTPKTYPSVQLADASGFTGPGTFTDAGRVNSFSLESMWNTGAQGTGNAVNTAIDVARPSYVSVSATSLSATAGVNVNLYDGTTYLSGGVAQPNPSAITWRPGGAVTAGWIFGANNAASVNAFLGGDGNQFSLSIPTGGPANLVLGVTHSYGGSTALEVGAGTPGSVSWSIAPLSHSTEDKSNNSSGATVATPRRR